MKDYKRALPKLIIYDIPSYWSTGHPFVLKVKISISYMTKIYRKLR